MEHDIEEKERVELLLQSLHDSYDNFVINVVDGDLGMNLVFNDVVVVVLEEEESRRKNKENKIQVVFRV